MKSTHLPIPDTRVPLDALTATAEAVTAALTVFEWRNTSLSMGAKNVFSTYIFFPPIGFSSSLFYLFLSFFSWGRWRDILSHARCKRRLSERDVETICRVILVFCLLHYRGDENIKSFIWELITPPENGREPQTLLNHSGMELHTPTQSLRDPYMS